MAEKQHKSAMAEKLSVPSKNKKQFGRERIANHTVSYKDGNSTARSCRSYRTTLQLMLTRDPLIKAQHFQNIKTLIRKGVANAT